MEMNSYLDLFEQYKNMQDREELIVERSHVQASFEGVADPDSNLYVKNESDRQEKANYYEGYIDALNWVLREEI